MRTLDPGALRHLIQLQRNEPLDDGCGGFETSWNMIADVWAQIKPRAIKTSFDEGTDRSSVTHQIILRWRDDCEPGMRFQYGARILNIRHVSDPDETLRYLVCECEETR